MNFQVANVSSPDDPPANQMLPLALRLPHLFLIHASLPAVSSRAADSPDPQVKGRLGVGPGSAPYLQHPIKHLHHVRLRPCLVLIGCSDTRSSQWEGGGGGATEKVR